MNWKKFKASYLVISLASTACLLLAAHLVPGREPIWLQVSELYDLPEEQTSSVEGWLTRQVSAEHYLLEDGSGSIIAEFDKKDFNRIPENLPRKVQIFGAIERNKLHTVLDVHFVQYIN